MNGGCFLNLNVTNLDKDKTQNSTENSITNLANPENIQIDTILSKQVSASWSAVLSATKYRIIISDSSMPSEHCTDNYISSSGVNLDLVTLLPNTTYYYRICADDGIVTSTGVTGSFKTLKYTQRAPAYSNFNNWNDYLINDGVKVYNASQTVCSVTYTGTHNSCINGGLIQKIDLPVLVSCDRIEAHDAFSAFSWNCDDSGATTVLYTADFAGNKSLMDLIESHSFKKNYVIIKVDGVNTYSSDVDVWWNNPIEELPDSPLGTVITLTNSGSQAGKIFVVSSSKTADKYIVNDEKISLVILKKVILSKNSSSAQTSFIHFNQKAFNWLEGVIEGGNFNSPIIVQNSAFTRIHNFQLLNFANNGISWNPTFGSTSVLSNFKIIKGRNALFNSGTGSLIRDGLISGMSNYPIAYPRESFVKNIIVANNGGAGYTVIAYPDQSIFINLTISNNSTAYVLRLFSSYHNLFHNLLISNSGSTAIYSWQGAHNTFSQFFTVGSSASEIEISATQSEANKFTNNLVLDNLVECSVTNDTAFSSGLTPGTCTSHGPYSDVNLVVTAIDQSKIFAGKVITTDLKNISNSLGLSLYSMISDWLNFDNFFRVWGADGSDYPNVNNKGDCVSGSCRIWDYRLLNDVNNLAFNSTQNVLSKNASFTPSATCPSAAAGSVYTTYTNTNTAITYTYLTNAMEIIGDGIGNENGLCESGESCIYTPNFGAYQGEGDYLKQGICNFQNGTINNVKLYAYPTNGI